MSLNVNMNTYNFCPSLKKIFLLAQAQPVLTQNFRKRNPQKTP